MLCFLLGVGCFGALSALVALELFLGGVAHDRPKKSSISRLTVCRTICLGSRPLKVRFFGPIMRNAGVVTERVAL